MYKGFSRIWTIYSIDILQSRVLPHYIHLQKTKIGNIGYTCKRTKHSRNNKPNLFVPLAVPPDVEENIRIGEEFTGQLKKQEVLKILNTFYQKPEVRHLASENGLEGPVLHQAFLSFRKHCLQHDLSPDLHITISDVIAGAGHHDDLFPYFIRHARRAFPHLNCLDDLKKISDLRCPANWYPQARNMNRKIIFHAGPTNSGKTYHAMKKFLSAKSGVYCGPLKLLATEIYHKSNSKGTPCDLITGEERRHASEFRVIENGEDLEEVQSVIEENPTPSKHVACTVEMASLNDSYDVAIIDEIQMIGDWGRGWAWTRALLGLQAQEIHLCGEGGTINLIEDICNTMAEELEVITYERLSPLEIEKEAIKTLEHVQPGDCVVCFNKADIYKVSRQIEKSGHEIAVIYGSLPPGTKLAQAKKFNDPESSCKIMVATDAIGLGINLSIRRIIFYSLIKPVYNADGGVEMDVISVSQALQIAGRAGRYLSKYESGGLVTTFASEDLPTLQKLLREKPDPVVKAGLHPTAEQMELYAYHLPHASLSSLIDIFVHLCTVDDSLYMMCNVEAFKFLAELIQHVTLPLRVRYLYCCAPVNNKLPFINAMFLKIVRKHSCNEPITKKWLCEEVRWPMSPVKTIADLVYLEMVFDIFDIYMWLSYRFPDMFPDVSEVREMSAELEALIQVGVFQITRLSRSIQEETKETVKSDTKKRPARATMDPKLKTVIGGKLSEELVAKGLITPDVLAKLQLELIQEAGDENQKPSRRGAPRKRIAKK